MTYRVLILLMAVTTAALYAQTSHGHQAGDPRVAATTVATMDSQRDIVIAVANPLDPPALHAGSSMLGYSPPSNYGAGQRAISTLDALKQRYGLHEVASWPIKTLQLYCAVLEPAPGVSRDDLLKSLAGDSRVALAQPLQDYSVYTSQAQAKHEYNDPYVDLQRGFVDTDAAVAHSTTQGDKVRVAIVDTGIDTTHPDLQGRIRATGNVVDEDAATFNRDRHGTEVAGVIAATGDNHLGIVGIAPKVELSVYKACWYPSAPSIGAHCNSFTLAKALAAIMDTDARVINLSLGGPADPLLGKLLGALLNQHRIVIAAMPPDGGANGFPGNAPGVIIVRVSGPGDASSDVLSAPGQDILTTEPGGGYDFTSGSSLAAAHVSGITALLLALSPDLDANAVHALLLSSSRVSDGARQVNAAAAVAALRDSQKGHH